MIECLRLTRVVVLFSLLLFVQTGYGYPELPAFNHPAKDQQSPGKLIWADLVTDNVEKAATFYSELFGWEAEVLEWEDATYALMKKDGVPVAGIFHREEQQSSEYHGVWLPYLSVTLQRHRIRSVPFPNRSIEWHLLPIPNKPHSKIQIYRL